MKESLVLGLFAVFLVSGIGCNNEQAQQPQTQQPQTQQQVATPASTPTPQTDSWQNVPANCQGFNNTGAHICEFVHTQVIVVRDPTRYDYWNHVAVEPGVVTDVVCTTHGNNIFRLLGAGPPYNKDNPWHGSHYGNVAICNGWINGGNGPVDMVVTYQ